MRSVAGYELVALIGCGGMGQVWDAQRRFLGGVTKRVALKLVEVGGDADAARYRRFVSEARLAMRMNHPNVAQHFDACIEGQHGCLAMELVEGVDLAALCRVRRERGGDVPIDVGVHICAAVLRALAHAHEDGVLHRDVTPHNVVIGRSGAIKLVDFGVAAVRDDPVAARQVAGKVGYMAPELRDGGPPTSASDLYGVGAILHELLTGAKLSKLRLRRPPPAVVPISPRLERLRRSLLDPDPDHRPATAAAALVKLERCPEFRDATRALSQLARQASAASAPLDPHAPTVPVAATTKTLAANTAVWRLWPALCRALI